MAPGGRNKLTYDPTDHPVLTHILFAYYCAVLTLVQQPARASEAPQIGGVQTGGGEFGAEDSANGVYPYFSLPTLLLHVSLYILIIASALSLPAAVSSATEPLLKNYS